MLCHILNELHLDRVFDVQDPFSTPYLDQIPLDEPIFSICRTYPSGSYYFKFNYICAFPGPGRGGTTPVWVQDPSQVRIRQLRKAKSY